MQGLRIVLEISVEELLGISRNPGITGKRIGIINALAASRVGFCVERS
jgi:hypothetical protein